MSHAQVVPEPFLLRGQSRVLDQHKNGDTETRSGKNPQCSRLPAGNNKSFFLSEEKKKRKRNGEINPCDPRQEHGTQNVVFHKHCGDADQGPTFPLKDWYRFTGNKKPLGGSVSVEQCTITCSSTRTNFEDIFNQTV